MTFHQCIINLVDQSHYWDALGLSQRSEAFQTNMALVLARSGSTNHNGRERNNNNPKKLFTILRNPDIADEVAEDAKCPKRMCEGPARVVNQYEGALSTEQCRVDLLVLAIHARDETVQANTTASV